MNLNHQDLPSENTTQSSGYDPKTSKRNSGLFAFFKWFKPSTSRESIDSDLQNSHSSSCDSLNSTHSSGTVASFSYVPPGSYTNKTTEKCIALGPETDTYKARLKQRDQRREYDKNITLRKKYNLFFNRDTLLKVVTQQQEENTKSLPLMTRATMEIEEEKTHRRTNSESSKLKKAGAYVHVKGKRKAPQPPGLKLSYDASSTSSLRRKKRLAPPPPTITTERVMTTLQEVSRYDTIQYADTEILCNDSLKLDHGILKSAKETNTTPNDKNSLTATNSPRSSYVEAPVSPRPWYKRNTSRDSNNKRDKEALKTEYEPIEKLPEVQFMRNSTLDLTLEEAKYDVKKKEEKRKSGLSMLANISELDREASEILKKEQQKNGNESAPEIPEFMRPKQDSKMSTDSWVSPKRRSARDLIAKFNAITNVTKVTVNSTFFGNSQKDNLKRDYFGKQNSSEEHKRQENLLETHKKQIELIDKKREEAKSNAPLMKSESSSAVKPKAETPKLDRKSWNCPKCKLENEYWRIICHVCSAIKPYFDDFSSSAKNEIKLCNDLKTNSPNLEARKKVSAASNNPERILERSKTQIGFSALSTYNNNINKNKLDKSLSADDQKSNQKEIDSKREEREKLKKMLIEMKNSLPKRKSNILLKQNNRASVIVENPEVPEAEIYETTDVKKEIEVVPEEPKKEKTQEQKVAEILIGTTQTIYENIKVRKTDNPKPIKVSSSAQTSAVVKKVVPPSTIVNLVNVEEAKRHTKEEADKNNIYELMRPKDFENIYSDQNSKSAARIYANLARNDELSLFFNLPKKFNDVKELNYAGAAAKNTDTIEINRLLRRLETSIAKGAMVEAANFAKELALLKVNCSVVRQRPEKLGTVKEENGFQIEMYVEDKVSHRGPFPIQAHEKLTVGELKTKIEKDFEIPINVQRWILGKDLATNDSSTLKDYNITEGCPVFLYLVAPDPKMTKEPNKAIPLAQNKYSATTSNVQIQENKSVKESVKLNGISTVTSPICGTKGNTALSNIATKSDVPQKQENKIIKVSNQNEKGKKADGHQPNITSFNKVAVLSQRKINVPEEIPLTKITREEKPVYPEVKKLDHTPKIVNVIPKIFESSLNNVVITTTKVVEPAPVPINVATKSGLSSSTSVKSTPTTSKLQVKTTVPESKQVVEIKVHMVEAKTEPIEKEALPVVVKIIKSNESDKVVKEHQKLVKQARLSSTDEDLDDYETKTLKPQAKEWECHLCTLLNPLTSNICAVCATVRKKDLNIPRSVVKKPAPQPTLLDEAAAINNEETYIQLVNLDNADLVENTEPFECVICYLEIAPREGATLRECLHQFCKECLRNTIEYTDDAEIKCPYRDNQYSCNIALQDREIKTLLSPKQYEQHLAKSVAQAENKMDKTFHCKTPDCKGWCIFEDNVNEFRCPVCRRINCLTCQAVHFGLNCKQYQEKMNEESEVDEDAKRTKQMLDEMVSKGEALTCPTCQVILMKKWGCDWLRCSMCKTEICWVTRGPRWGPAGKGDTSGGCKCGVNGVKCHPQCNYCH